jgi:antitoxin (DNA-binding transcriptional repressor) of toxin-antitoxin stability system
MKTMDVDEASAPLAEYARKNRRQTLLLTRNGKPYAALTPISTPTDLENLKVSSSAAFRALIARSRRRNPPGSGMSTEEVRRALARRRTRRPLRARPASRP